MEKLGQYLPALIPLMLIQLGLMVSALVHVIKHGSCRIFNRTVWICLIVLVNLIGPVLYFVIGRGEEERET